MKLHSRLFLSVLFLCLVLLALPMNAAAETVTETTGWIYDYMFPSGYNLPALEIDREVTMRIDFECTFPYPSLFVDRGRERLEADSFFRTYPDNGSDYIYGFYAKYTLEPGTYNIFFFPESVYSDSGAFGFKISLTYDAHTHSYEYDEDVKPTCTSRGYIRYTCSCGDSTKEYYGEKLPHTVVDGPTVAPTCAKDGKKGGKKCSKCGTYTVAADVIPATGLHTEVVVEGKAPTCTETGLTDGIKCSVCGKVLLERETIPAGHAYEKGANYDTCTRCGLYKGELDSGLEWTLDAEGHLVVTGTGSMNSRYSQSWEELSDKVTRVTLPDGLTSIGYGAFRGMKIDEIKIPNTVTSISSYAFADCTEISSVVLPNALASIGRDAFAGCTALKGITIPESVTTIEYHAFAGCTSLEEITIPGNVTTVGTYVFADSGLRKAVLSEGMKSIAESMFADAAELQEVILPESLESVKDGAFSGCSALTEFTFPENITYIAQRAFQDCTSLRQVSIPQKVRKIEEQAFRGCTSLEKIDLSGTYVQYIYEAAFKGCTGLKKVVFSNDITSIDQEAFAGCTGLTQIVLKRRIPELEKDAFQGVVAAVHCPTSLQGQWESKWSNYDHGGTFTAEVEHTYAGVVTPPTCTEKGYTTYTCTECGVSYRDDYVDVVHNVENGICTVCKMYGICGDNLIWTRGSYELRISGTGDMYDYEQIGELAYEKTSTSPWHSIYGGRFLCVVIIEEGVTSIGDNAFYNLENLEEVQIAGSVTKIGTSAFEACPLLEEVTIPDSVTEVGARAFYGCSDLKEVTLSANMTTIPDYMFFLCDLEEIALPEGLTKIGSSAFLHSKLKEVILPDTVTEIGERAFGSCEIETIVFPEAVTTIGAYAFNSCQNLVAVTIPETVTQIGEWAFSNCTSLVTFTLPASVTEMSSGLLKLCTALETVYFEGDLYPWYWKYQDCFQNVTAKGYYTVKTDYVVSDTTSGTGRITWERYVPCAEHDYGAWEVKRTSTCSKAGVEVSTCTVCKHQKAQVINKPEHAWTEWTITKEPTEWWEGSKTRSCSECGEKETEVLPAHVHEYTEETVTPPTCTERGYTTYTCECGDDYVDTYVGALGHKWDAGIITKEPTEEAEGQKFVTCTVCNESEYQPVPKLEHTHKYESVITDPTYTAQGYTTHTCACGDSFVDSYVDPRPLPEAEVAVARMILGNELAMQFAFPKDKIAEGVEYVVSVTKTYADGREDKNILVPMDQWGTSGNYYYVSFNGIAAKEMGDTINAQILTADGVAVGDVYVDSIREYALRQLRKATEAEIRTLYVDMLNYGAAAQTYFKYDAANLVSDGLTPEEMAYGTKEVKLENNLVKGTGYVASQLDLGSSILLRVKFNGIDSSMHAVVSFTSHTGAQKNITIPGSEFISGGTVVVINQVVAADYNQDVTITVYDASGNVVASAVESVASYLARQLEKPNPLAIYDAVAKYCAAAYGYLHK